VRYFPRVIRYLRPYWNLAGLSVGLTILSSLAALLVPWPLQIIVDNVIEKHRALPVIERLIEHLGGSRTTLMITAVMAGLLITLLINALHVLNNYVTTKLQQFVVLDFRGDLFQQAQRLSLAFHDHRRSGRLIHAINHHADAPAGLALTVLPLAESALTLIGMFVISYRINPQLALLSLTVVPFLYYSVGYYATHVQKRLHEVNDLETESLSIIHEAVAMLRVIVAFGREDHEYRRFRRQGECAVDARVKVTVRQTMFSLAVNTITAIGTALVLGFGAYQAMQGRLTVGELLVVMAYIAAVYRPLEAISFTIGTLQTRFTSLRIAFDLLDTEAEIRDAPSAITLPSASGHIVYEHVAFAYANRSETLRDISFEVKPGQVIAVVGPTGAGKTTLVSLLPRFYDAQDGRISLDGYDIRSLTLRSLRGQISIVLQEPLLFSGTIADNIRYGRLDATTDEITAAAKAANAHDFIQRLPDQYNTVLGERGAAISVGERQRISIARAFLKSAPILILDEPTSSIDSKTEAVILDALERLMVGRTTFMIAHRLSTVRNADLILVMDHGQIIERGTQEQLLQRDGLYRSLYETQTAQARRKPQPAPA